MSAPVGSVPAPSEGQLGRGYGSAATDYANNPTMSSPLAQSTHGYGGLESSHADGGVHRSASTTSTAVSRSNTLKKRSNSVRRTGSLKRSSSRKSLRAGSIKGFGGVDSDGHDFNSAFFTPIPTSGTPTEALADRFQAWRQLLKSLVAYFREIQNSYETRAKALHKVQNTIANIAHPAVFMSDGLSDATRILDDYHKRSINEAQKSRDIEDDVIGALNGLRSDLGQKIKEIKSLSGDFKNSVDREQDNTRREVEKLQEALAHAHIEDGVGRSDPYVVKLGVERALEKQIDEENYLHRAYLNLESSGRELESIVVGEIQKAYNALAGILKREGDDAYHAVEALRTGPITMPKDREWYSFVTNDEHFVDPGVPLRRIEDIEYPGKHHPAATEIRAGMLERKSKYLKSYTAGWYVLSPTHLHEFKSADKIYSQPPVMSLYLPDQKLGSHSEAGSSSHKFMLKGRQTGGMHKGHNWVFRAESQDTMLAWYADIKSLTEATTEQRTAFVREHARSVSAMSDHTNASSDGLEEDEADRTPYSADAAQFAEPQSKPVRPQPGGRFPSDLALRTISGPVADDEDDDDDALPQRYGNRDPYRLDGVDAGSVVGPGDHTYLTSASDARQPAPMTSAARVEPTPVTVQQPVYNIETVAPVAAAAVGGAGVGAVAARRDVAEPKSLSDSVPDRTRSEVPAQQATTSSGPIMQSTPTSAAPIVEPVAVAAVPSSTATGHTSTSAGPALVASSLESSEDLPTPRADTTAEPTPTLGGNERVGAHVTGSFFPSVVRHDTDISVSRLHVPGEFPKKV